jgi:hypothetical protein
LAEGKWFWGNIVGRESSSSPLPSNWQRFACDSTATARDYQADELIIAFRWLASPFYEKVLIETALSENLGETSVLMNYQHPSQQKFFDLLAELEFFFLPSIANSVVDLFQNPDREFRGLFALDRKFRGRCRSMMFCFP